jgi:hypothetical protein
MEDPDSPHGKGANRETSRSRAPRRRLPVSAVLRPVLTATGLVVAYYLLPLGERFAGGTGIGLVVGLIAVMTLFAWQVRSIARSPYPRLRAVEALAITIPLFLLLFATTYYLLEKAETGSFTEPLTRTDSLYFTLTVASTVGFGDIVARSEPARVVTMIQMVGDIMLVGVAARLVVEAVRAGLRRQAVSEASPAPGRGGHEEDLGDR